MSMEYRAYQAWAARKVAASMKREEPVLMVKATGLGKTYTMLSAIDMMRLPDTRVLILAHRNYLLSQWAETIAAAFPHFGRVAIMGQDDINGAQVILSTIQLLTYKYKSGKYERLVDLLMEYSLPGKRGLDVLVVDECHRSVGGFSYPMVISLLQKQFPNLSVAGCTATPHRTDSQPLGGIFTAAPVVLDTGMGQNWNYLTPHKVIKIPVPIYDVPQHVNGDDANEYAVGNAPLDNPDVEDAIWQEWSSQRELRGWWLPTIAFSSSVQHAKHMSEFFRSQGVASTFVAGVLGKKENERRLEAFKRGEIEFVANVGVLTEGFSHDATECIIFARFTVSELVSVQCIGRGLRISHGKEQAVILQVVSDDVDTLDIDALLADGLAYVLD